MKAQAAIPAHTTLRIVWNIKVKTVIARFAEVKKLVSEGELTGVDSEGEAIEINKVDTALRSVGISLTDFINGSVGLDEIFDQLGRKWDTLDTVT